MPYAPGLAGHSGAFEAVELEKENRRLMATVRRQYDLLRELEAQDPGISHVTRDAEGAILLPGTSLDT